MGLHAYMSILGMELVMAVNDVVQRAQNGERGFGPQTSGAIGILRTSRHRNGRGHQVEDEEGL